MKLEIRLRAPRYPAWLLVTMAALCWVLGLEHRLDGDEKDDEEEKSS